LKIIDIYKDLKEYKIKRYFLALFGLITFSSGICLFGEALIRKYDNSDWFAIGTLSLILINGGLGIMIKNKWGTF
jgi:hypothetical protein|tara:strand:- start:559 stop:783 length:225 start_codon:yes stop_codon:yes gene_type:complete